MCLDGSVAPATTSGAISKMSDRHTLLRDTIEIEAFARVMILSSVRCPGPRWIIQGHPIGAAGQTSLKTEVEYALHWVSVAVPQALTR